MKNGLKATLFAILLALSVSIPALAAAQDDRDFPERDEINQTYQLGPGASVQVTGINGAVDVETGSGTTAEVHIVRTARTRADLEQHRIFVEQSGNTLTIRGESDRGHSRRSEVRQRVTLRLPRQVNLSVSGINGRVNAGELEGSVNVSGVNGKVFVAQAQGDSDIHGINGSVVLAISRLGDRGLSLSGINGGVDLRLPDNLNADLHVTGLNGNIKSEVGNLTVSGTIDRSNFHAKVGAGGPPINVRGVNGHVRIGRITGADMR